MEGFSVTQEIMDRVMKRSSVLSSFPLLFICLVSSLCSFILTGIILKIDISDQLQTISTLSFVLLLLCVTLLAPCPKHDDGILIFCIRVLCVVYAWASTVLVVSMLM